SRRSGRRGPCSPGTRCRADRAGRAPHRGEPARRLDFLPFVVPPSAGCNGKRGSTPARRSRVRPGRPGNGGSAPVTPRHEGTTVASLYPAPSTSTGLGSGTGRDPGPPATRCAHAVRRAVPAAAPVPPARVPLAPFGVLGAARLRFRDARPVPAGSAGRRLHGVAAVQAGGGADRRPPPAGRRPRA